MTNNTHSLLNAGWSLALDFLRGYGEEMERLTILPSESVWEEWESLHFPVEIFLKITTYKCDMAWKDLLRGFPEYKVSVPCSMATL